VIPHLAAEYVLVLRKDWSATQRSAPKKDPLLDQAIVRMAGAFLAGLKRNMYRMQSQEKGLFGRGFWSSWSEYRRKIPKKKSRVKERICKRRRPLWLRWMLLEMKYETWVFTAFGCIGHCRMFAVFHGCKVQRLSLRLKKFALSVFQADDSQLLCYVAGILILCPTIRFPCHWSRSSWQNLSVVD